MLALGRSCLSRCGADGDARVGLDMHLVDRNRGNRTEILPRLGRVGHEKRVELVMCRF